MELNQSKSSMKRTCEDYEGQQSKSQRIEPSDESSVEIKTTKIIDVNDDCLVKIFGHLDVQDLFNVAVANEWLRPAANDVYKRKFGTKMVYICGCDDYRPKTRAYSRIQHLNVDHGELEIRKYWVIVLGLKTTLQYLRCFGSSIKELTIAYHGSKSKRYGFVHQYINDYCAECLVRLTFYEMPNMAIEQFQTKFMNVDEIYFWLGNLADQWSSSFKCFPNLRRLDIRQQNISLSTLLDSIKGHQSISDLIIESGRDRPFADSALVKRLISEHPAFVTLDLDDYTFTTSDVLALIRQLHSLKHFRFCMSRWEYESLSLQLKDDGEWVGSKVRDRQNSSPVGVELARQT